MKVQLTFLFCLLSVLACTQSEKTIVQAIQADLGGRLEQKMPDGSRVDLLTSEIAYEIDFASKWKESIGQALWYSLQSGKKPGIILIRKTNRDYRYVQQLYSALQFAKLNERFIIKIFPDDFACGDAYALEAAHSKYWISNNSKKRHKHTCHNYENTNGRYCNANDGIAAGCCGG